MRSTYNIKSCKSLQKVIREAVADDKLHVRCLMTNRTNLHIFYTHPETASQLNEITMYVGGISYMSDETVEKIIRDIRLAIYFPLLESVDKS